MAQRQRVTATENQPQALDAGLTTAGSSNMTQGKHPDMKINVAQLLKEPTGAVRRGNLSEDITGMDDDLEIKSLLTGPLKMIRTADSILVTASLRTALGLQCSRCLEPFSAPVELEIEEEFYPRVDIHTGAKIPVTQTEEEAAIIDEQHVLDLAEVVRQAIFLALPMHPLCTEDCAGLCSQCGQNFKDGPCECTAEVVDPRLEILKQLL